MSKGHINADVPESRDVADVFKKYQSPLKGFIAKRVPLKEDVEDILQNVFLQLAKIDQEQAPILQMSSWLYSVARNQIIDRSRKKREEEMPYLGNNNDGLVLDEEIAGILLENDSSPEMEFLKELFWEELDEALKELPAEQREVFELTELEGFSFKEISEATNITVNTLISRKRYAVLHLRKRLYELYEDFVLGD